MHYVYKNPPYDPLRDLAPVTQIFANTFGLIVTPSLPVTSVKALATLANARPHQLSYGSAGLRNTTHLGADPSPSTPEAFASLIKAEAQMWSKLIRTLGLEQTQ